MIHQLIDLWFRGWRSLFEILLLTVAIYYGYLYFRGTRGAKVLTGLAIVFLTLTLISTLLNLVVIGWICTKLLGFPRSRAGGDFPAGAKTRAGRSWRSPHFLADKREAGNCSRSGRGSHAVGK